MALTHNPTRTRTIEKRWFREINKRWAEFEARIIDKFYLMNKDEPYYQGIGNALNNAAVVSMSAEQMRVYMAYVNQQIAILLNGNPAPRNWQNQYQLESYMRGYQRTRDALVAQGAQLIPTAQEQAQSARFKPLHVNA